MRLENGTFVGFQTNNGPTFGLIAGHIPRTQLQLVRYIAPDKIKGTIRVPMKSMSCLGEAHKDESDADVLERHCLQVVRYLVGNPSTAWQV